MKILNFISPGAILVGYRGSVAHGMYIKNSNQDSVDDVDYFSVVIPNLTNYFGLTSFGSRGTRELFYEEIDLVEYELIKFIKLLIKNNPNVISWLWLEASMYVKIDLVGSFLLNARERFLCKEVYKAFCGYASAQLVKMERKSDRGFRGKKRQELFEKYGYDTKNAAHCIRLLRMGIEILDKKQVFVDRTSIDAEELLEIKTGKWSVEQVKKEAEKLFDMSKKAFNKSTLRETVDLRFAEQLCVDLLKKSFRFYEPFTNF